MVKFARSSLDYYWSLLTQGEQTHARGFYFIRDKNRYIIARAILRKLISSYINISAQDIVLQYTEHGKPYLSMDHHVELKFNLAHFQDCIVYGFTKNIDVGIDTEFINKDFAIDDIVKYCCSKQEQYKLHTLSWNQKYSYFYKLWVIKEALVKAMGVGLSYDLRQVHINFGKNKLIQPMSVINHHQMEWRINMFRSYNNYLPMQMTPLPTIYSC